jgi:ubiquinone/menaquinone biosynthesis C-methylase UbiE
MPAMDALERLRAFRARDEQYRDLGHNRGAAARFVAEAAGLSQGAALDVGTGKGLLAIELARAGMEVVSVDLDADEQTLALLLALGEGVSNRIRFEHGDAAHLPHPDSSFGCVAMMDVLHHLHDPVPVLAEMARVLAPGGRMVVADFDEQGFDLVTRVHRAEGREHPRTAVTVSLAEAELMPTPAPAPNADEPRAEAAGPIPALHWSVRARCGDVAQNVRNQAQP